MTTTQNEQHPADIRQVLSTAFQPAAEIPNGIFYTQQHGGTERWIERTRDDLLIDLQADDPPAFRTVLGATELDEDGKPARLSGGFYADFDGDLEETSAKFREFLGKLESCAVDLAQCRLYATGGRGFHVEIPPDVVGVPAEGLPDLHRVYREMAMSLFVDTLDLRVYSSKRQWRVPNVKRENGRYKVPLTPDEARTITPESYVVLTATPRPHPELQAPTRAPGLVALFGIARDEVGQAVAKRRSKPRIESVPALPSLDALFGGALRLKASTGWNQIAMQVALIAQAQGLSEDDTIERCKGLIEGHRGDGSRYATPKARERELRDQYRYTDHNLAYEPSLYAIAGLLDEAAPDLIAAAQSLEADPPEVACAAAQAAREDRATLSPTPSTAERKEGFPEPFPGVHAAIVAAGRATARKDQADLIGLAALVGMAGAIPGCFQMRDGTACNLYAFGIAETGAGKDHPRHIASRIAEAAQAPTLGQPASGEGLEDALPDSGSALCAVDEIGHVLAAVNSSRAGPHLKSLAGALLRLYSASQGRYHTRQLATAKGRESRTLERPALSLMGFTTPSALAGALGEQNVEDGLLGRFLIARGRDDLDPQWTEQAFELPPLVAELAERIRFVTGSGGPVFIDCPQGATDELKRLMVTLDREARASADPMARALRVRAFEKVKRIACTLAVWAEPESPALSVAGIAWALRLVQASDAEMVAFVGAEVGRGEVQRNAEKVRAAVAALMTADPAGLGKAEAAAREHGAVRRSEALRRCKLSKREFDEAVGHLVALGDVFESVEVTPGGRGHGATQHRLHLV